jgi:formylglycine-generating enzyme required for sulfatase activity
VNKFAMGKFEVTFAEATTRTKPDDESWERGNRPEINVSWYDAIAYAAHCRDCGSQWYNKLLL